MKISVNEILKLKADGLYPKQISAKLGTSTNNVYKISHRAGIKFPRKPNYEKRKLVNPVTESVWRSKI